ncbi:hypothetical protein FHR99_003210 [Litorivivens lipolytica]|uniref:Uncharacterized protein n=1 Tax=Litorivivens lipolytica TaxID=1524264 RepID=A0A7W4W7J8_9GAMM|nr:hypothetical protein [Litorivivens lipolytica]MBB3048936.1 hypothetical protein [Litorivivens lipolytica]
MFGLGKSSELDKLYNQFQASIHSLLRGSDASSYDAAKGVKKAFDVCIPIEDAGFSGLVDRLEEIEREIAHQEDFVRGVTLVKIMYQTKSLKDPSAQEYVVYMENTLIAIAQSLESSDVQVAKRIPPPITPSTNFRRRS